MERAWYVLRSKPRKELSLLSYSVAQGHEVYYPQLPPAREGEKPKPYFPGYMFVHTSLEEVGESTFRWMPFSRGLVWIGGEPATVAEFIVRAIQERVQDLWRARKRVADARFRPGEPVRVLEGPFEGYEGLFDASLPGSERVRVLLKMLHDRYVAVEMEASSLISAE